MLNVIKLRINLFRIITILDCDGTGHQGYAKDPVPFNNTNLYFRGENNTKATIN